jgi:hypothetical protein
MLAVARHAVLIASPIERAIMPCLPAALLAVPHRIAPGAEHTAVACHQAELWCHRSGDDVVDPGLRRDHRHMAHGAGVPVSGQHHSPQRLPLCAPVERLALFVLTHASCWRYQRFGRRYQAAALAFVHVRGMKTLILVAVLAAVPLAAQADSSIRSKCDWVRGVIRCQSWSETEHSKTQTLCGFGDAGSECKTRTVRKEPELPITPKYLLIAPGSPDVPCVGSREACAGRSR